MILHINFTIPFRPSVQFFNLPTIRYIIENLQSSGSGTISENFFLNLTIVFSNFFWFSHGGGRREIYRTSTIYLIPYYHAHSRLKSKKGTIFKEMHTVWLRAGKNQYHSKNVELDSPEEHRVNEVN